MKIKEFLPKLAISKHPMSKIMKTSCMTILTKLYKGMQNEPPITKVTAEKALEDFYNFYSERELWRLFVDGRKYAQSIPKYYSPIKDNHLTKVAKQHLKIDDTYDDYTNFKLKSESTGWISYELKEPGSLAACINALRSVLDRAESSLYDVELVKTIHKKVTTDVKIDVSDVLNSGNFRTSLVGYFSVINKKRMTVNGILDLLSDIENGNLDGAAVSAHSIETNTLNNDKFHDLIQRIFVNNPFKVYAPFSLLNKTRLKQIRQEFPDIADEFLYEYADRCFHDGYYYYTAESFHMEQFASLYAPLAIHYKSNCDELFQLADMAHPKYRMIIELIDLIPESLLSELKKSINNNLIESASAKSLDKDVFDSLRALVEKLYSNKEYALKIKSAFPDIELLEYNVLIDKLTVYCIRLVTASLIETKIENLIKANFKFYYDEIKKCECVDEILFTIGKTIQRFERIHSFLDFNGRTFVNVLLNVMLLENGFPPATFYEPNLFDAHDDIVHILKRGIANTLEIYESVKQGKPVDLFGVTTDEVDAYLQSQIDKFENEKINSKDADSIKKLDDKIAERKSLLMDTILKKMDLQPMDVVEKAPSPSIRYNQ